MWLIECTQWFLSISSADVIWMQNEYIWCSASESWAQMLQNEYWYVWVTWKNSGAAVETSLVHWNPMVIDIRNWWRIDDDIYGQIHVRHSLIDCIIDGVTKPSHSPSEWLELIFPISQRDCTVTYTCDYSFCTIWTALWDAMEAVNGVRCWWPVNECLCACVCITIVLYVLFAAHVHPAVVQYDDRYDILARVFILRGQILSKLVQTRVRELRCVLFDVESVYESVRWL